MKQKVKLYRAWFYSKDSLQHLAELLSGSGIINKYHYDCENVYEWVIAESGASDWEFNISRKHCDFDVNKFELEAISVTIMFDEVEPGNELVERQAKRISRKLSCNVFLGAINYLGGDDFEYLISSEIIAR